MKELRKVDFCSHVSITLILLFCFFVNKSEALIIIMVTQFFIGIYQVISSIIRTVKFHSFDGKIKTRILIYWGACLFYGIGWIIGYQAKLQYLFMGYILSAWIIAFYYCYITYLLAFPKFIKSHLDI